MPNRHHKTRGSQIAIVTLWLCSLVTQRLFAQDRPGIGQFEQDYSIKVILQDSEVEVPIPGGSIKAAAAGFESLRYVHMVVGEFRIYPTEFVRASKLKRIVICSKLEFNGQLRAAVPDFAGNTLYLDSLRGAGSGNYQRAVIHHEFFHIVDYQDDGIVYQDANWKTLNPTNFEYGKGGTAVQEDSSQSGIRKPTQGFLTKYSLAGVEEDKAELFAHLIVSPKTVANAVESDEVLDQKVATLKALIRRFCPELDHSFWKKIAARQAQ